MTKTFKITVSKMASHLYVELFTKNGYTLVDKDTFRRGKMPVFSIGLIVENYKSYETIIFAKDYDDNKQDLSDYIKEYYDLSCIDLKHKWGGNLVWTILFSLTNLCLILGITPIKYFTDITNLLIHSPLLILNLLFLTLFIVNVARPKNTKRIVELREKIKTYM